MHISIVSTGCVESISVCAKRIYLMKMVLDSLVYVAYTVQWISLNQTPVNRTSRLLPFCHNLVHRFDKVATTWKSRVRLSEIHCILECHAFAKDDYDRYS